MKILMLTPYLPYPPASGGQVRTYNLLNYLSKKHSVTLVSLYKNDEENKFIDELRPICKEIHLCRRASKPWQPEILLKAIFTNNPLLVVRNYSKEAKHLLNDLLVKEQFDVIHAETFYIMPHIPPTNIPILLVEQTIEYMVYQHFVEDLPVFLRPLFSIDIIKLKRAEKHYWQQADLVAAVSEADQKVIHDLVPGISPQLVPNGAGDEMFVSEIKPKKVTHPTLLFMGNYFWLQNKEAADYIIQKIYPELKKKIKDFTIVIAGQEAQRVSIPPGKHFKLVNIPHDDRTTVKKLYEESSVFIAPIYGPGGTRLKILAAMASGLPIVSTQIGVEGLDAVDGTHAIIANNPAEFAEGVAKVLGDMRLYESLRKHAYSLVKAKFSWSSIASQLEVMYRSLRKA